MPVLEIKVNKPLTINKQDFIKKASKFTSTLLNKSENYVLVVLEDTTISFGGTTDLAAIVRVSSIGRLGLEENKVHSSKIAEFLSKELGIPKDRYYIFYVDLPACDTGFDGSTFA
jgi:phenylpyruvate tautomerase